MRGESDSRGKEEKKHWHVFRDNKYMHVRKRERESGLFSARGCHGNRGLATDADVQCSQMLGT